MEFVIIGLMLLVLVLLIVILSKLKNQNSDYALKEILGEHERGLRDEMLRSRQESKENEKSLREELLNAFRRQSEMIENNLSKFGNILNELIKGNREELDKISKLLQDSRIADRNERSKGLKSFEIKFTDDVDRMVRTQKEKLHEMILTLEGMQKAVTENLEKNRNSVEMKLTDLQKDNNEKLEKMRETVDEKLQSTLQKRIGESFQKVQEQLERVHVGLGKMQSLADGVGDLKKVLSNVKERGTWGEVKLGAVLEQMLTAEQYEENVKVKPRSQERVDYAIKLPGKGGEESVWLPIDAKFPQESYLKILDASKVGDKAEVDKAVAELIRAVRKSAGDIRDKYINPPYTTDFAIMFLPTEGLYSEVLRVSGVLESIQQDYRIVIAGPTTLSAILNSLRMGFKTLAIEKKASEVWKYLAAVKTQFRLFGTVMEKLKDQVNKVSKTIDDTDNRTKMMDKKLRALEDVSNDEAEDILGIE